MKKLLILLLILSLGFSDACYQETANVSTACGGLSTGSYSDNTTSIFYINYTKPSQTTNSSLWQVKHGTINQNVSLSSCWDAYNNIQRRDR